MPPFQHNGLVRFTSHDPYVDHRPQDSNSNQTSPLYRTWAHRPSARPHTTTSQTLPRGERTAPYLTDRRGPSHNADACKPTTIISQATCLVHLVSCLIRSMNLTTQASAQRKKGNMSHFLPAGRPARRRYCAAVVPVEGQNRRARLTSGLSCHRQHIIDAVCLGHSTVVGGGFTST